MWFLCDEHKSVKVLTNLMMSARSVLLVTEKRENKQIPIGCSGAIFIADKPTSDGRAGTDVNFRLH